MIHDLPFNVVLCNRAQGHKRGLENISYFIFFMIIGNCYVLLLFKKRDNPYIFKKSTIITSLTNFNVAYKLKDEQKKFN